MASVVRNALARVVTDFTSMRGPDRSEMHSFGPHVQAWFRTVLPCLSRTTAATSDRLRLLDSHTNL